MNTPSTSPWTGPFIGAQLVSSWSGVRTSESFAATGVLTNRFDDNGSGFGGGLNAGYNWLPWNNGLVGIVFDANWLDDKAQHDFGGGAYIGSVVHWSASAQARTGLLVTPQLLLYGQAGLSFADQSLKIDFGGPKTDESKITPGWTLGGGLEWMPANNLFPSIGQGTSFFISYEHTWWNKAALDEPAASPAFNYSWERQSDQVTFSVRVRFGGG